jgi:ribonuclease inhibitor
MREIIFDTSHVENMDQLHAELARCLDFPAHYGRNLDALYDCLSGEMELPVKLIWRHYDATQAKLGADVEKFLAVLDEFSGEEPDFLIDVT